MPKKSKGGAFIGTRIKTEVHERARVYADKLFKDVSEFESELLAFALDRYEFKERFKERFAPNIEHLHTQHGSMVLWDNKQKKAAELFLKDHVIYCELDKSLTCIHVQYAELFGELGKFYAK